jgi:hypothetical protein
MRNGGLTKNPHRALAVKQQSGMNVGFQMKIEHVFGSRSAGKPGMLDIILTALRTSDRDAKPPELSFAEMQELVEKIRQRTVKASTLRSLIYRRRELFDQVVGAATLKWRLSKKGREVMSVKLLSGDATRARPRPIR